MGRDSRINPLVVSLAQRREEAQRLLANNSGARVFDRFGQPIVEGCMVVWQPDIAPSWHVTGIVADLSPQAQPGVGKITLTTMVTVPIHWGAPIIQFMVAGYPAPEEAQEPPGPPEPPQEPQEPQEPPPPPPPVGEEL